MKKQSLLLPSALATMLFLFSVVSCREVDPVQPKPKNRGARSLAGSNISYGTWSSSLTSGQRGWIQLTANQMGESDTQIIEYDLYSIETTVGQDLRDRGLSDEMSPSNPFYCYIVALYSEYVYRSYGAYTPKGWITQTVNNDGPGINDNSIDYNYNVGIQYVQTSTDPDLFTYMFINGTRFMVPGAVLLRTYYDVKVYRNPFGSQGSFTLPGGSRQTGSIYLDPSEENDLDLLKHEFGHILQAEALGRFCYYNVIAYQSIDSAQRDGVG
ncbi:MAG: hypothetical protein H7X86_10350, partial [Gorillibacterium sp.]|nr:hypothetical protein [Gorillibacterium sp.]